MSRKADNAWPKRLWVLLAAAVVLGGYWLLPIGGQVLVVPGATTPALLWPQMRIGPTVAQPGKPVTVWVTDNSPWAHVELTLDGKTIALKDFNANPGGTWTWRWELAGEPSGTLVFFHSCQTGCVVRGGLILAGSQATTASRSRPTKLGVVFASPKREWHGRSGWDVELTYARLADREYWGVDDLAGRVQQASENGLRVLVRVDYAQSQSLPPANDQLALSEYIQYLQRLARDARLGPVYGYIVGSNFNDQDSNLLAPDRPVTPEWYARIFNGFGETVSHSDNVVQTIRTENSRVRVLVGPVQPWNRDQNGKETYTVDAPWLNYMNTLVDALDRGARSKAAAGVALAAPDGFAVQAPGRPDAPELAGRPGAEEPRVDLRKAEWGQAQAGFRVYRDWLDIVNAYASTRGLPLYITSTNTYAPDQATVPAQNYVRGWLTSALEVVDQEPQVQALCWFLDEDRSGDVRWDWFSLNQHPGRLIDAAEELDELLQR